MNTAPTPASHSRPLLAVSAIALLGLLLVLALRLTMTEVLRQNIAQKAVWIAALASGKADELPPVDGPALTATLAFATFILAAIAAFCAARAQALRPARLWRLLLIMAILALSIAAALTAASRFNALVGAIDLATSLLAGWAVSLLCSAPLLGDRGRRMVVTALIAILAIWSFKGIYQRFVEFPETIADYQKHRPEQLKELGIPLTDQTQVTLFESRMMAKDVSGFVSYSNVMATGMIGLLAVLAGLLAAGILPFGKAPNALAPATPADPARRKSPSRHPPDFPAAPSEVSLAAIWITLALILLAAGILTAILTHSRGGATLAIAAAGIIAAGTLFHEHILAWRRVLLITVIAIITLSAAATVAYGLKTDSLPTKSLNFRWHYWTAAAQIIRQHPLSGIGLNNFGDHYLAVKRPSSPEDVTDPHSYFLRLASEIGLPGAALVALLIAWKLAAALRPATLDQPHAAPAKTPPGWPFFLLSLALCGLWWILHFFLTDAPVIYNVYLAVIFTLLGAAAAWMAAGLCSLLSPAGMRVVTLAALVGALAMLAYDQINMALVTGPVAMLFLILLGLADSYEPLSHDARTKTALGPVRFLPAILCCAVAFTLAAAPLLPAGLKFLRNPAPFEFQYIRDVQNARLPAALDDINHAIFCAPRSIELRMQKIAIKQQLHQPVAGDIRSILSLDHANARPRITLAMHDSDLPPQERARILEEALHLDLNLAAGEPKRLSPAEVALVQSKIHSLNSPSANP